MSELTVIPNDTEIYQDPDVGTPERIPQSHFGGVEQWLRLHLDTIAVAITVAAFGLRVYLADGNYLNPDEALHYQIINQQNIWLSYKASLTNAHPPLIYLIVYFWRFLGRSELMLRMPSVLAGTAACWLGFKWAKTVLGETAGAIALFLLAFSPGTVILSVELRAYALLLGCMTGSLYFLAQAFEKQSPSRMWIFSAFLYLSILSHYSALFFAVSVGVYALDRFIDSRFPTGLVAAWMGGQIGALGLYGFLYETHLAKIKSSTAVWLSSFGTAYFEPSSGNIFAFTTANTFHIFAFFFAQRWVAWIVLLSFIAGAGLLFRRDILPADTRSHSEHLGLLLSLPFLSVWGASLVHIYPYVGSRHTAFLAPFAIAGASSFLARVSGQKISAGLLVAAALMVLSQGGEKSMELNISPGDNSRMEMHQAIHYMDSAILRGDTVLVDMQSALDAMYYFCGPRTIVPMEIYSQQYFEFHCKGDFIVSLHNWKAFAPIFPDQFEGVARSHKLSPGDRVWFYQTGWGDTLDGKLDRKNPNFSCLAAHHFGTGVVVIPFIVGPDFRPFAPCPA